jgi:exodeoxyribonuclease VII large subunit
MPRSPYEPLFERVAPPREEVLSVADLNGRFRRNLQSLGQLLVEGEVSGFKGPAPTGHLYFTLKDEREEACISCVMFRRDAQAGGGARIVNGARVRVRGSADLFNPRGALQLLVTKAMAAGEGDLAARREALKRKLTAEGLFDESRKRKLPSEPRVIGVVTSATGAAFQDIVKVARRRGNVRILLSPAQVQGEAAAYQIRRALERIAKVTEVDVIILGRGGGSAEDLAAFDDEHLARAIASCPKPVVAAVGHEVDWSIACLVADVRAATPSQAAELVVPDFAARRDRLDEALRRLGLGIRNRLKGHEARVARLAQRVRAPERALKQRQQQLDELHERIESAVRARVESAAKLTDALERRLSARHPRTVLAAARQQLSPLPIHLNAAMRRFLQTERGALAVAAQKLDAISPLAVLSRGYAIALHNGVAVRDAEQLKNGDRIEVRLAHGEVEADVVK